MPSCALALVNRIEKKSHPPKKNEGTGGAKADCDSRSRAKDKSLLGRDGETKPALKENQKGCLVSGASGLMSSPSVVGRLGRQLVHNDSDDDDAVPAVDLARSCGYSFETVMRTRWSFVGGPGAGRWDARTDGPQQWRLEGDASSFCAFGKAAVDVSRATSIPLFANRGCRAAGTLRRRA